MNNHTDLISLKKDSLICLFLLIISLSVYFFTLPPTATWGDSCNRLMLTYDIQLTTTVGVYPLTAITGRIFRQLMPFFYPAFTQNFLSAFFASLDIFLLYLIILLITKSRFSAISATLAFLVSHTFWLAAVINDSFTLHLLFFNLLLLLFILWIKSDRLGFLYGFSFVSGLSFFSSFTGLFLVPAVLFILWRKRKKVFKVSTIAGIIFYFILGLLPWLYCLLLDILKANSFKEFVVWFRRYGLYSQIIKYGIGGFRLIEILKYPFYLFYQFPLVGFLLGLLAMIRVRRDDATNFIFILFLTVIIYASGYFYQRHFHAYLFSYLGFAIFIGLGVKELVANRSRRFKMTVAPSMVILPVLLYSIVPYVVPEDNPFFKARDIPYRNNVKYFLQPSKRGYWGTYKYARSAFEQTKKGDIIITDFTILPVLRYFKEIEKLGGKGVRLVFNETIVKREGIDIPEYIRREIGKGTGIYLADDEDCYHIEELKKEYDIIPAGVLYKVQKR